METQCMEGPGDTLSQEGIEETFDFFSCMLPCTTPSLGRGKGVGETSGSLRAQKFWLGQVLLI